MSVAGPSPRWGSAMPIDLGLSVFECVGSPTRPPMTNRLPDGSAATHTMLWDRSALPKCSFCTWQVFSYSVSPAFPPVSELRPARARTQLHGPKERSPKWKNNR
jgi:hypothetical protein